MPNKADSLPDNSLQIDLQIYFKHQTIDEAKKSIREN